VAVYCIVYMASRRMIGLLQARSLPVVSTFRRCVLGLAVTYL